MILSPSKTILQPRPSIVRTPYGRPSTPKRFSPYDPRSSRMKNMGRAFTPSGISFAQGGMHVGAETEICCCNNPPGSGINKSPCRYVSEGAPASASITFLGVGYADACTFCCTTGHYFKRWSGSLGSYCVSVVDCGASAVTIPPFGGVCLCGGFVSEKLSNCYFLDSGCGNLDPGIYGETEADLGPTITCGFFGSETTVQINVGYGPKPIYGETGSSSTYGWYVIAYEFRPFGSTFFVGWKAATDPFAITTVTSECGGLGFCRGDSYPDEGGTYPGIGAGMTSFYSGTGGTCTITPHTYFC